MRKMFLTALAVLSWLYASAQSIDGLEFGSYYSINEIRARLSGASESSDKKGNSVFTEGVSSFFFDFTGAAGAEEGRLVNATVCDEKHTLKFPFGTFRVGDSLEKLLFGRADLDFAGYAANTCMMSSAAGSDRSAQATIKYNTERRITEIYGIGAGERKSAKGFDARFFNSVQSAEIAGVALHVGDPLTKLLSMKVDIVFSPYGNGICCVTADGIFRSSSYLVRYDNNHIVKEILPL